MYNICSKNSKHFFVCVCANISLYQSNYSMTILQQMVWHTQRSDLRIIGSVWDYMKRQKQLLPRCRPVANSPQSAWNNHSTKLL